MNKIISKLIFVGLCFYALCFSFAWSADLEILSTNDVHGRLLPFNLGISDYNKEVGGVAKRVTLIKDIRKNSDTKNILLLDAGDLAQGTIFFNLYNGKPDIKFMNEMSYDAMTLGNHEFDKGSKSILEMYTAAKFPFLAANIEFSEASPLKDKVKPYIIKDFGDIKVGIIGIITEEIKIISNPGDDIKVLDSVKTAQKYIDKIDNQTDIIIILSHSGLEADKILAKNINNADIIIGGHSHDTLKFPVFENDKDGKKIIISQAGEFGKYLGDIKLDVDNDRVVLNSYQLIPIDYKIKPDPEVNEKLKGFYDEFNKISSKIIGETKGNLNFIRDELRTRETSGGNFVCDIIRKTYPEADIAMINSGGIRSDKIVPAGKITLLDMLEVNPFENQVILFNVKGAVIKTCLERSVSSLPFSNPAFLQISGVSFIADVSKKPQLLSRDMSSIKRKGHRISNIKINGKPIDLNKTYKIATNDYLFNGGNAYWVMKENATDIKFTNKLIIDVLKEYVKKNSPLESFEDNRIKIINIPKLKN